jgi:hypothetical protein
MRRDESRNLPPSLLFHCARSIAAAFLLPGLVPLRCIAAEKQRRTGWEARRT